MEELQEQYLESKKMREQPIGRLLFTMSIPAILSMLVQALYNVVDTFFISLYKPYDLPNLDVGAGVSALTIAMPFQLIVMAFAIGIGVGTSVIVAKRLGEGKAKEASQIAQTGVILAVFFALIFVIVAFTLIKPFVFLFNVEDPLISQLAQKYLFIVVAFSFGNFIELCLFKILQGTGNMKIPMISQLIGAGLNIILDPIFIFDWGFGLGVIGAAIATVLGQIGAMIFVVTMFLVKKYDISLNFKGFRFRIKNIGAIAVIGLPTTFMNAVSSLTMLIMNYILSNVLAFKYGKEILGTYFKLQSFIFMPIFGLTQGALPILSYNHGWGNKKRFMNCFKLSLVISLGIMFLGLIIFQLMPDTLMKIFNFSGEALSQGSIALRRLSLLFLPAAVTIIMTTVFQSLRKGIFSFLMSLMRQVAFTLPLAYILGKILGQNALWFSYPIGEIATLLIFLPICIKTIHKNFVATSNEQTESLLNFSEFN